MIDRLRRDPGFAAVVIALIAVAILYAPTVGYGFVNYDDSYLIRDNWILQQPSWSSLHTIFFDLDSPKRFVLSPEYLPVRDLSIMLDIAIWGHWYPGFHLTNLVLYLIAIVLWFAALEAFGIERKVAGLAALVWAVHPSHAESVAWLAERKGLLAALFAGAAALSYARYRAGRHGLWLAVATLAAVAAIWSKAPAAFAIAGLAGLEVVLPARRASWSRALGGLGVLAVVSATAFAPVIHLATSSAVVGGGGGDAPAGRLAMVLGVHGFYLQLGGMGLRHAISYPISSEGPTTLAIVIGAVGLVGALFVAFAPRGRAWSPAVSLRAAAILWLVSWLPVSHLIVPLQMIVVADRYLLLPTLGLALAFAVGVSRIASVRARRALIGVVVVAAAMRTCDARSNWRDGTTLWERAVRSNPHDGVAWAAYAEALTRAGDPARAAEVASQGLRISRAPRLLLRKALLLLENDNRPAGARAMRDAALAGEPRAMSNLSLLLLEDRHLAEALEWARRGATSMPMYAPAKRALGRVALAAGHAEEAATAFTRAYELEPTSCINRYNLALALIQLRRSGEARLHLEACLGDLRVGVLARTALLELAP